MHAPALSNSNLPCVHQGKTRDTFELPDHPGLLLVVATDRVSTHNVVHTSTVPEKGYVLTALTVWWLANMLSDMSHHLVAFGPGIAPYLPAGEYPEDLARRALVVRELTMYPVEFIWRRRLMGSLWKAYQRGEDPYGLNLPPGLSQYHRFAEPVFTPTDKSETDDPLPHECIRNRYAEAVELAKRAFLRAEAHAARFGLELVDTKLEFGVNPQTGEPTLGDEILTTDSSRYVAQDDFAAGREPAWYDKQVLRDEAERQWAGGKKVPLTFSDEALRQVRHRSRLLFYVISSIPLDEFQATWKLPG